MKRYRNEWKYICNEKDLILLKGKLNNLLTLDEHSNNGSYTVHNVYFDDYKNTCASKTEAGDYKRFKWRIRYYDNDTNNIRLELKEKLYGRCHKETCKLTKDEYKSIMAYDTSIVWKTNKLLLKRFCIDMMNRCFRPKIIIDYERFAYVDKFLNIRITFDKCISASYEVDKFLERNYIKMPIQNINNYVLEVKFDDILPMYIKVLLDSESINQISFSKYYNGLKALEAIR